MMEKEKVMRCISCGSKYFVRSPRGTQCKMCGHVYVEQYDPKEDAFTLSRHIMTDVVPPKTPENIGDRDPFPEIEFDVGEIKLDNDPDDVIELTPDMTMPDHITFRCDKESCLAYKTINLKRDPSHNQHVTPCIRCGGIMFRSE